MVDQFTIGHFLYNAHKLRKIAAATGSMPTPAPQRNPVPAPQRPAVPNNAITTDTFMRQQGMPDISVNAINRNNANAQRVANTLPENQRSQYMNGHYVDPNNPGSSPVVGKNRVRGGITSMMRGVSRGTGYELSYGNAPQDQSWLTQNHNTMNNISDFIAAPWFTGAFYLNNSIPQVTNKDNYVGRAVENTVRGVTAGVVGGTTHKWAPAVYNAVAPQGVKQAVSGAASAISKAAPMLGPALKTLGPAAGVTQTVWSDIQEGSKSLDQLKREEEAQAQNIRARSYGNTTGAKIGRVWNNFWENGVPAAADAVGHTLTVLGMPEMGFLSNGRTVRNARLYNDAFTNNGGELQSIAMDNELGTMDGWEVFGGGATGGSNANVAAYQNATANPIDMNRLRAWNKQMRDAGYTTQQIHQMHQQITQKYPNYFAANTSDADRNRTNTETLAKLRSERMQRELGILR